MRSMKSIFSAPAWFAVMLLLYNSASAQTPPEQVLLKDYRPKSIFKIPETRIEKARYLVIDVHSHYFAKYHWPMHAFALPDVVLNKICHENAASRILGATDSN